MPIFFYFIFRFSSFHSFQICPAEKLQFDEEKCQHFECLQRRQPYIECQTWASTKHRHRVEVISKNFDENDENRSILGKKREKIVRFFGQTNGAKKTQQSNLSKKYTWWYRKPEKKKMSKSCIGSGSEKRALSES